MVYIFVSYHERSSSDPFIWKIGPLFANILILNRRLESGLWTLTSVRQVSYLEDKADSIDDLKIELTNDSITTAKLRASHFQHSSASLKRYNRQLRGKELGNDQQTIISETIKDMMLSSLTAKIVLTAHTSMNKAPLLLAFGAFYHMLKSSPADSFTHKGIEDQLKKVCDETEMATKLTERMKELSVNACMYLNLLTLTHSLICSLSLSHSLTPTDTSYCFFFLAGYPKYSATFEN